MYIYNLFATRMSRPLFWEDLISIFHLLYRVGISIDFNEFWRNAIKLLVLVDLISVCLVIEIPIKIRCQNVTNC